jgi:hypothetical protein
MYFEQVWPSAKSVEETLYSETSVELSRQYISTEVVLAIHHRDRSHVPLRVIHTATAMTIAAPQLVLGVMGAHFLSATTADRYGSMSWVGPGQSIHALLTSGVEWSFSRSLKAPRATSPPPTLQLLFAWLSCPTLQNVMRLLQFHLNLLWCGTYLTLQTLVRLSVIL